MNKGASANFLTYLLFLFVFVCMSPQSKADVSACQELKERPKSSASTPAPRMYAKDWFKNYEGQMSAAKNEDWDVAFLGDSLTNRWPAHLWKWNFSKFRPMNFGVEGDLTQNLLWRIQNGKFMQRQPDAAVVMIGVNNGGAAENVAEGIVAVSDAIIKDSPKTKIIIVGVLPHEPIESLERINKINKLVSSCADGIHVRFLDLTSLFLRSNSELDRTLYIQDGLHLQSKAYERMAAKIKDELEEIYAK